MTEKRIGLMGYGTVAGYGHVPAILATPDLKLAAVYDPNPARLAALRQQVGTIDTFGNSEAFFNAGLDAVVITSPAPNHYENVSDAVRCGLPVLCEKPLAVTLDESQAIVDLMDRAGLPLFTAFCYRFSPCALDIKTLVADGTIGVVRSLRLVYNWNLHGKYVQTESGEIIENPRRRGRMLEGGPLIDCGVHQIDLARWWLDSEVERQFAAGTWVDDYEAPDHMYLHLDHSNGAHAFIEISVSYTHTAKEPRSHFLYELIGTEGVIRYDREEQVFEVRNSRETRRLRWHEEKNFEGMYSAFAQALQTGEGGNLPTGRDGLSTTRIAAAATDSVIAERLKG
jgi:predicted dehydrogenase